MFHQSIAAFYPVAIVQVQNTAYIPLFCVVDMTADNAVYAAAARFARQGCFEPIDGFHRPGENNDQANQAQRGEWPGARQAPS